MVSQSNFELCERQGHAHKAHIWFARAAYLSGGGLSGRGLEAGGGLQVKADQHPHPCMCSKSNMKPYVRAGHLHEACIWSGKATDLSGGGLSGGGLKVGGGLQEKTRLDMAG